MGCGGGEGPIKNSLLTMECFFPLLLLSLSPFGRKWDPGSTQKDRRGETVGGVFVVRNWSVTLRRFFFNSRPAFAAHFVLALSHIYFTDKFKFPKFFLLILAKKKRTSKVLMRERCLHLLAPLISTRWFFSEHVMFVCCERKGNDGGKGWKRGSWFEKKEGKTYLLAAM